MKAHNHKEMAGNNFGRLTVLSYSHNSRDRKAMWNCICNCGKRVIASGKAMRTHKTNSCGCYMRDRAREANTTHGETIGRHNNKRKLYNVWCAIKSRTSNPMTAHYANYGGRGIRMCDEWFNFYATFRQWAESHGYTEGLTIERIDVNGNYEPSNCKWITQKEQSRNKTNSIIYNGEIASEASVRLGGSKTLVASRLRFYNWTIERAFTQPRRGL